jgi:O-antigen/teichoic acid export membrane protein
VKRTGKGSFRSHAAQSLAAAVASTAITVVTLPYIVGRLGLAEYGLFTLLSVSTAYLGMLDFGFSWSSSRFLAEAIEQGDEALVAAILRVSLTLYLAIGLVGGVAAAGLGVSLVRYAFHVPARLEDDGVRAALILAAAFPFAMLQVYVSAVLRGARRFDLSSGMQLLSGPGSALALVAALASGAGLVGVSLALAAAQALVALIGLAAARWTLPTALSLGRIDMTLVRSFGRFSLAVGTANIGSQLLYVPNRLAVGLILPIHAAGLFSVPFAIAQRLLLVPNALVSAALPTMTAAVARDDRGEFWRTFWSLASWLAAILVPISLLAWVWAHRILVVWISSDFASATWVLRLALIGVLLNAATAALGVACTASGIPRIEAFAALVAGSVNISLALLLTWIWGIVGSAAALTISLTTLSAVIVLLWRRAGMPAFSIPRLGGRNGFRIASALIGLTIFCLALVLLEPSVESRARLIGIGIPLLVVTYSYLATVLFLPAIGERLAARPTQGGS